MFKKQDALKMALFTTPPLKLEPPDHVPELQSTYRAESWIESARQGLMCELRESKKIMEGDVKDRD
jgi:hypothetical protein